MSGTKQGGIKAAATNKKLHGEDFYARIGSRGGKNGHTGGFAANPQMAKIAGRRGGLTSSRAKHPNSSLAERRREVEELIKLEEEVNFYV